MNPLACLIRALLVAAPAAADDVGSTIHGGIGAAWRDPGADPPYDQLQLEYDTGTLLFLDLASHYDYGLLLRVTYTYTLYDALTALGGLSVEEDIEQHDGRAGLFYAPWSRGPLGFRLGGGYAYAHEDVDAPAGERTQDGGFVEVGLIVRAARALTLDIAGAGLKWEGNGNYDAEAAELRIGATFHTDPLDLMLGGRYARFQRESPADEELYELRLGIGGRWGYPEN